MSGAESRLRSIVRRYLIAFTATGLVVSPAAAQTASERLPPDAESAPIAYLYDLTSQQVLFEREADRRFMPASITKVMTAYLAFEWMEEGRISPQQSFAIRPDLWREWQNVGSTMFLPHDARVTVNQLLLGVTTVSANDGSAVLADRAAGSIEEWVAAMNAKAAEIGMENSRFGTPNGWMDEGRTFTTARDLTTLAEQILLRHPVRYRQYFGHSQFTYNGITQPNHDPITGVVRGADGLKTGFTNQAGFGFLGSAERSGQRLVVVIAGSPRARERNRAARDLLEWGFSRFKQARLFAPDVAVAFADVQGGARSHVALTAARGVFVDRPSDRSGPIELSLAYEGPVRAPIRKGETLGTLTVRTEGMKEYTVPLVARDAVPEAGFFRRIYNGIAGWLA